MRVLAMKLLTLLGGNPDLERLAEETRRSAEVFRARLTAPSQAVRLGELDAFPLAGRKRIKPSRIK